MERGAESKVDARSPRVSKTMGKESGFSFFLSFFLSFFNLLDCNGS